MNVPDAVGVPVIVATLLAHDPVTPAGNPEKVAPVAPVVANVILVIAELIQTVWFVPAAMVLSGVTVNTVVLVQPVDKLLNVNVTEPAATPVTKPELFTVAKEVLLLVQVPPVDGVTLAVDPEQTCVAPPKVGVGLKTTFIVLVLNEPDALVITQL